MSEQGSIVAPEQQPTLIAPEIEKHSIVVPGDPVPWERAGARIAGKYPKQWISFYPPTQTKEAEAAVAHYWRSRGLPLFPAGTPLAIRCLFVFARPTGHYGTGRNAAVVKPQYRSVRPGGRGNKNSRGQRTGGDFDNLLKLVCDGLNGVAYQDDGQICEDGGSRKLFVDQLGVHGPATLVELWAVPS